MNSSATYFLRNNLLGDAFEMGVNALCLSLFNTLHNDLLLSKNKGFLDYRGDGTTGEKLRRNNIPDPNTSLFNVVVQLSIIFVGNGQIFDECVKTDT